MAELISFAWWFRAEMHFEGHLTLGKTDPNCSWGSAFPPSWPGGDDGGDGGGGGDGANPMLASDTRKWRGMVEA